MANTLSNSEWIEQAALRAVYDSASYSLKQSLGLKFENIKGVICSASSIEPSILINRCFASDPDLIRDVSNIVAVKQFYADIGVGEFLLHIYSPDLETQSALQQAGMKKSRGWMKFTRDISPAAARKSDLVIRKIGEEHAEAFARIVVPCFDMTEASIPLVASIISHPHWQLYMGYDGEMPAATGGLFYMKRFKSINEDDDETLNERFEQVFENYLRENWSPA